jgi:DNA polymerase-1
MSQKKKLFIIDLMAFVYRHYHSFKKNPLKTADGFQTGCIFGLANDLMQLMHIHRPDYMICATDESRETFRQKLYPDYKAHRPGRPEEIKAQLPLIHEMMENIMGIPVLYDINFEADDIIGSIVTKFRSEPNLDIFIASGDKDFLQLVGANVTLYAHRYGGKIETLNDAGCLQKMGVHQHQIIDYLALVGDASDNVPGVDGVGEKSAVELLSQFGSLENIYIKIDSISSQKLREKLLRGMDSAFLSKELVTIKIDLPIDIDLSMIAFDTTKILVSEEFKQFALCLEMRRLSDEISFNQKMVRKI